MTGQPDHDVVVIGAGPAGLSLCAALLERGLRVGIADTKYGEPFAGNYCVFVDGLSDCPPLRQSWDEIKVSFDDADHGIACRYGHVDNSTWQRDLLGRVSGAEVHRAHVTRLELDGDSWRVEFGETTWSARVVIDATGAMTPWLERSAETNELYQRAYGAVLDEERAEMTLMDWRGVEDGRRLPPTFLYSIPLDGGRTFVEETVLISHEKSAFADLKNRLEDRMRAEGFALKAEGEPEQCHIRMNIGRPHVGQGVVAFGASAGYVHPATGYSIDYTLRRVARVADAVAANIEVSSSLRAERIWNAVWTPEEIRADDFYRTGARMLAGYDQQTLARFFEAFFAHGTTDLGRFLRRELTVSELYVLGVKQFIRFPFQTKREFVRGYARARR